MSDYNEYLECSVDERKCYIAINDLRIVYGLTAHRTEKDPLKFADLPDDTFIVKILLTHKGQNTRGGRVKELGAGHLNRERLRALSGAGTPAPRSSKP